MTAQRRTRLAASDVGTSVRLHRSQADLTQTALAEAMAAQGFPWHPSTASKVESGDRDCSVPELVALAEIFGVTPEVILSVAATVRLRPFEFDVDKRREHAARLLEESRGLYAQADQMEAEADAARAAADQEVREIRQRARALRLRGEDQLTKVRMVERSRGDAENQ